MVASVDPSLRCRADRRGEDGNGSRLVLFEQLGYWRLHRGLLFALGTGTFWWKVARCNPDDGLRRACSQASTASSSREAAG